MRAFPLALLAAVAALILPATALADIGDPDVSFGTPGSSPAGLLFPVQQPGRIIAVDTDLDDRIYALATTGAGFEVWKLNGSGAFDTTWSTDGRAPLLLGNESFSGADFRDLVVNPDGSVYAGGSAFEGGGEVMLVAKLGPSGARDATFHDDGIDTVFGDFKGYRGNAVARYGNGGVVIAGKLTISVGGGLGSPRMGAVALQANGQRAQGASTGGVSPGQFYTEANGEAFDVAVDVANRVVVAGKTMMSADYGRWMIARWGVDGTPDGSFAGTGEAIAPEEVEASFNALKLQGDKLYTGGFLHDSEGNRQWAVWRFHSDGVLDAATTQEINEFGNDGVAAFGPKDYDPTSPAEVVDFELEPDGAVRVVGTAYPTEGAYPSIGFARLSDDGSLDTAYAGGGRLLHTPENPGDEVGGTVTYDGDLLVGAQTAGPWPGGTGTVARPTLMRIASGRTAPINTAAPLLSGTAKDGEALATTTGEWHSYGDRTYEYAWQQCDSAHEATRDVAAATDCRYVTGTQASRTSVESDVHKYIRAVVIAVNDATPPLEARHATATSEKVEWMLPQSTGTPTLAPAGDVGVGQTLEVTDEKYVGSNLEYTYTWFRCPSADSPADHCISVPGTGWSGLYTGRTYTTTADDAGYWVGARVWARPGGWEFDGYNASQTTTRRKVNGGSGGTGGGAPVKTADPTIEPGGSVTEGDTLKMTSMGSFTGTPAPTLSRQWMRCGGTASAPTNCSAITGSTGETYKTTAGDAGKVVRLRVVAENASGFVNGDSSGREVKAPVVTAPVNRNPAPAAPGQRPVAPSGPRVIGTTHRIAMPSVVGLTVDEARDKIARAGIVANVVPSVKVSKRPLVLNGKKLDPGQIHSQSTAPGTQVTTSLGAQHRLTVVVEGGAPGLKACQAADFRKELKGVDLEATWKLLEEKKCAGKVNLNFKVAGSSDEPEVQSAAKDGGELRVTVVLPSNPAEYDLFPEHRQGAFPSTPMPSFGADDLSLTSDVDNIFGVKVYDRYVGIPGQKPTGARTVVGAQVYVDGDGIGIDDEVRKTNPSTGDFAIFSRFAPKKAGIAHYLVQAQDASGNKIFGHGWFRVKQRSGKFTTIAGETYDVSRGRASRVARAAGGPVAQAASANQIWGWVQGLFAGGPLQTLTQGASSASEGLIKAAKQSAGAVIFAWGAVSNAAAQMVRVQAATVVAAGGANVVAAGGANVVSAGGANVVAAGGANVVSAGGANLLGRERVISGTGQMRALPDPQKLISDNGLGLLSDNGLGLQGASKIIGSAAGNLIGTAAGNLIGTASGNILAQNNANLIGAAGGNLIGAAAGN